MKHKPARILAVSPAEYHADPCETPSLSASIAKMLIEKSPKHAWLAHPKLGAHSFESTQAMDDGSVIHKLILGKGVDIVEVDAEDFKTKAAREIRDAAKDAGKIPVLVSRMDELRVAADAIKAQLVDFGIELSGQSELAATWTEEAGMSGEYIQCRCMFDHVILNRASVFDVKKIVSADPETIARQMYSLGYDVQWAAYTGAVRALKPEHVGREQFTFIFCEIEPPYSVTPVRPDGQFRQIGTARWERAKELWHRCLKTGKWPGYTESILSVSPPGWAIARELGNEFAAE